VPDSAVSIVVFAASGVLLAWGIAHILPTRNVVRGFGDISRDNRLVVIQTWVGEGLTLCFVAVLASLTMIMNPTAALAAAVRFACALMLLLFAVWHWLTGSRTPVVPMKVCPFVLSAVAGAYLLSVLL